MGETTPDGLSADPFPDGEDSEIRMRRPLLFGDYELLRRLRTGGMAELYTARRAVHEQQQLVVKRLLASLTDEAEYVAMFLDEARLAVRLDHPNIVKTLEIGQVEDTPFMAMELVEGQDLSALIRRARESQRTLPIGAACEMACRIADALAYAHELTDDAGQPLGIVHRDLSPHNVLVSYAGDVKLIDFGVAKSTAQTLKTRAGMFKGKYGYLSPEQASATPVDARSDIFSLGICLYEMLAGRRLFEGASDFSTLQRVREAAVAPLEDVRVDVPKVLAEIIARALAREPSERFESAQAMADELRDFMAEQGIEGAAAELSTLMHEMFEKELAGDEDDGAEATREPDLSTGLSTFDDLDPVSAISVFEWLPDEAVEAIEDRPPTAVLAPRTASVPPPIPPAANALSAGVVLGGGDPDADGFGHMQAIGGGLSGDGGTPAAEAASAALLAASEEGFAALGEDAAATVGAHELLEPVEPAEGAQGTEDSDGEAPAQAGAAQLEVHDRDSVVSPADDAEGVREAALEPGSESGTDDPPAVSTSPLESAADSAVEEPAGSDFIQGTPPAESPSGEGETSSPDHRAAGSESGDASAGGRAEDDEGEEVAPSAQAVADGTDPAQHEASVAEAEAEDGPGDAEELAADDERSEEATLTQTPVPHADDFPVSVPDTADAAGAGLAGPPGTQGVGAAAARAPVVAPAIEMDWADDDAAPTRQYTPARYTSYGDYDGDDEPTIAGPMPPPPLPRALGLASASLPSQAGPPVQPMAAPAPTAGRTGVGAWADRLSHLPPQVVAVGTAALVAFVILGLVALLTSSAPAVVHLRTTPVDAQVRVNGKPIDGTASPFVIAQLEPGVPHRIEVSKDGHRSWGTTLTLSDGELIELPAVGLLPNPAPAAPAPAPVAVAGDAEASASASDPDAPQGESPAESLPAPQGESSDQPQAARQAKQALAASAAGLDRPRQVTVKPERGAKQTGAVAARPRPAAGMRIGTAYAQGTPKRSPFSGGSLRAKATAATTGAKAGGQGGKAMLRVNSRPWSVVFVDGRRIGNTPQMGIPLKPGKHRVVFKNDEFDVQKSLVVKVAPGQTLTKIVDLAQ